MTAVDARFAGGPILVERDHESTDVEVVRIEISGQSLRLLAHEARALAAALTEAASGDGSRRLRRPSDVDQALADLDG